MADKVVKVDPRVTPLLSAYPGDCVVYKDMGDGSCTLLLKGNGGPLAWSTVTPGATGGGGPGAPGQDGEDGRSAYQVAVDNGFVGSESAWLASLVGQQGIQGIQGIPGTNGTNGSQGIQGLQGIQGNPGPGLPSGTTLEVAKKTSDQTIATATATNVTQLSFPVTANRYYRFRFDLLVQSNTATVGVAATVTIPAFTRFGAWAHTIIAPDAAGTALFSGAISGSGDVVIPTAVPAINTDYVLVLEGLLIPQANGTLQLQARTETGTTNVVVRQGSIGTLWDHGT